MSYVRDRARITKAVSGVIDPEYTVEDFNEAMKSWWKNIRVGGGLGLTVYGAEQFDNAEIESSVHPYQEETNITSWTQDVLLLDRKMPCPYLLLYQKNRMNVQVYDSSVATMIYLTGTVEQYINTL